MVGCAMSWDSPDIPCCALAVLIAVCVHDHHRVWGRGAALHGQCAAVAVLRLPGGAGGQCGQGSCAAGAVRTEQRAGNEKAAEAVLAKALQDCPTSGLLLSESIRMAPRPAQKAKSTDALKKNASDPYVLATIAELFWRNRKVDNARMWFKRSLTSEPKIGDHWAAWYRFELQFGTPEGVAQVMAQCVESEPNRGEVWNRVAKQPKNSHDKFDALLKKVSLEQAAAEKAAGMAHMQLKAPVKTSEAAGVKEEPDVKMEEGGVEEGEAL
ncbi:TPR_REGION domain-containing protein [Haematococcus lacustris]|uniref:TPR_REGION domain-containing protein n=1 Tax=Haematococcus lacustris TaxID=44745 RepID=A0A699Y7X5_HAELA|nr:TPR_REGION domain-containing protein [Haematococcus lacustris]